MKSLNVQYTRGEFACESNANVLFMGVAHADKYAHRHDITGAGKRVCSFFLSVLVFSVSFLLLLLLFRADTSSWTNKRFPRGLTTADERRVTIDAFPIALFFLLALYIRAPCPADSRHPLSRVCGVHAPSAVLFICIYLYIYSRSLARTRAYCYSKSDRAKDVSTFRRRR